MASALLTIRPVSPGDGPAFFALRREAILKGCQGHYPPETLRRWTAARAQEQLAKPIAPHFYAGFDAAMVVCGMLELESGRIDAVFVAADRQGEGFGRLMMAHLEKVARAEGLGELNLHATLNAAPFYRRVGFEGEGVVEVKSTRGISIASVPMRKSL